MKTLYNKIWYTPSDIARLGLIQTRKGDEGTYRGNYNYVLELIKAGELKAKNYSVGSKRAYYLVSEDQIKNYIDKFTK